ncbi:MAG: hypothetical protein NW237_07410 [Cyanobacteriota bacterium]|nr:hypothetical protein [Cyanobacteriota bacterium]
MNTTILKRLLITSVGGGLLIGSGLFALWNGILVPLWGVDPLSDFWRNNLRSIEAMTFWSLWRLSGSQPR